MNNLHGPHEEIADKIKTKLKEILLSIMINADNLKQTKQMDDFIGICKEYHINPDSMVDAAVVDKLGRIKDSTVADSAKFDRDYFFSTVTNKIVDRMTQDISPHILGLTIKNIEIKTEGKEYGIKFDVDLFTHTIKPYVQFSLVFPPLNTKKRILRINFEIQTSTKISQCEIISYKNGKKISGNLHTDLQCLITGFEILAGSIETRIELQKKEYTISLFDFILPKK